MIDDTIYSIHGSYGYPHHLIGGLTHINPYRPLVNVYITMENHHFEWENQLQMAMFNSYEWSLMNWVYMFINDLWDNMPYK